MTFLFKLTLVIACIYVGPATAIKRDQTRNKRNDFDLYIFTLHWPYTTCMDWEREEGHKCAAIDKAQWSVHGLWPTRKGEINPNFCNNSWPYSHQEMEPIMEELKEYWPDVEMRKVKDSLWSHEWTKHGTCAAASAQETHITGQTQYFRTGCKLAKENNLTDWLAEAGVIPHHQTLYETRQVWDAVLKGTGGFRPHIDCERIEGSAMISEIKVCYHKNLTRTNCDGIIGDKSDMAGKCLRYSHFLYPAPASVMTRTLGSSLTSGQVAAVVSVCLLLAVTALVLWSRLLAFCLVGEKFEKTLPKPSNVLK